MFEGRRLFSRTAGIAFQLPIASRASLPRAAVRADCPYEGLPLHAGSQLAA